MIKYTPEQSTLFNLAVAARESSSATTLEGFLLTEEGRQLLAYCQEAMGCSKEDTIFLATSLRRKLASLYVLRRQDMYRNQFVVDEFRYKLTYYSHWSGIPVTPGSLGLLLAVLDGSYEGQREPVPAPQPEKVGAKAQHLYAVASSFIRRQVDEVVGGVRKDAKAWHNMVRAIKKG